MKFKKLGVSLLAATVLTTWGITVSADSSYEHIRNATGKLTYNDTTILIDPFFASKNSHPGFEGTFNETQRMPLVDLPKSIDEILKGVDVVVVTHTHLDHWDDKAAESIDKNMPIYVQHKADQELIKKQGFTDVRVLSESTTFGGVTMTHRNGSHGTEEMYENKVLGAALGESMGVVFSMPNEKTVYLVGDTIWTPEVTKSINKYNPDVLIMNTGYAKMLGYEDSIIMGTEDVGKAAKLAPNAKILTVHMDTVNHTATSRDDMRKYVDGTKLNGQVTIPEDGETVNL
ncbi:MBL fold metallo-hydrolase [Veillonella intestinalis]|uniref:MBL fold metallo-hydrolase n=1 Tax=Veillonella intestinalis TaxID=2941341 RepID=UPI00204223D2|nr:MBL fold metallo-hydrolase [Veillonella intestinalis]